MSPMGDMPAGRDRSRSRPAADVIAGDRVTDIYQTAIIICDMKCWVCHRELFADEPVWRGRIRGLTKWEHQFHFTILYACDQCRQTGDLGKDVFAGSRPFAAGRQRSAPDRAAIVSGRCSSTRSRAGVSSADRSVGKHSTMRSIAACRRRSGAPAAGQPSRRSGMTLASAPPGVGSAPSGRDDYTNVQPGLP